MSPSSIYWNISLMELLHGCPQGPKDTLMLMIPSLLLWLPGEGTVETRTWRVAWVVGNLPCYCFCQIYSFLCEVLLL